MDQAQRQEIKLEVQSLLYEDLAKHREHLERQGKLLMAGFGFLVGVAATMFYLFIGQTKNELKEHISAEVDSTVLAYRVNELMKAKLEEQLKLAATSKTIQEQIAKQVEVAAAQIVPQAVGGSVKSALERQSLPQAQILDLLEKSIEAKIGGGWSWGGAYDRRGDQCVTLNPYTGMCECPANFQALDLVDAGVVFCYRQRTS